MKRIATIALSVLVMAFCATAVSAQDNSKKGGKNMADRWKAEKIAFLTDAMDLTSAEAERFWPVYNKAEAEKRESWKRSMDAYKALEEGIEDGKDDKEIAVLLDKYISAQKSGQDIDARYVAEYSKILPSRKVAKLYIGEEAFRRMQIHRLNKNDNSKNDKK